jgi:hypothetical protein
MLLSMHKLFKESKLQLVTKKNTSNSTKTEIEKSFGQNFLLSLAQCVHGSCVLSF